MSRHTGSSPIVKGEHHDAAFRSSCTSAPERESSFSIAPGVSVRNIFTWVSIGCTVFTFVANAIIMAMHMAYYTKPREQRHILRILSLPATYAIYNLLAIIFYEANIYTEEVPKIFQAFAIASLFQLFLELALPDHTPESRDVFFERLPRWKRTAGLAWKKDTELHNRGSLRWFRVAWLLSYSYIPLSFLMAIAQWISAATQCPFGYAAEVRKLVLSILTGIAVFTAMYGMANFERRLKGTLNPYGTAGKVWGIRLFVAMSVILNITFAITQKAFDVSDGTAHMNYDDFNIGLPDVLFEAFMVIFSIYFFWAFSWKRYRALAQPGDGESRKSVVRHPPWRALFEWFFVWDLIKDTGYAMQILGRVPFGKRRGGIGYRADS